MANSSYKAGLEFVVSLGTVHPDDLTKKTVRGHATRAGKRDQSRVKLKSWIHPSKSLQMQKPMDGRTVVSSATFPGPEPGRFGSDLSGLKLPTGFDLYMVQELSKLIHIDQYSFYPYEICLTPPAIERGWFPYMISDRCCLHALMFSLGLVTSRGYDLRTRFHYGKALQLLQIQIDAYQSTSTISDATIMVIFILAFAAELTGDLETVNGHVAGLKTIVDMRGGMQKLGVHRNLHVKICRTDLSFALLSGLRPRFFQDNVSWDCFIADRGLIHCTHDCFDDNMQAFLRTSLGTALHNVWRDLHTIACMVSLAHKTRRKLSPKLYDEVMISILYRLAHLSFPSNITQEVFRMAFLAISSTLYMQNRFSKFPYGNLLSRYQKSMLEIHGLPAVHFPRPIVIWLILVLKMLLPESGLLEDQLSTWLADALRSANISTWEHTQKMLRSIAWVDFIHDLRAEPLLQATFS